MPLVPSGRAGLVPHCRQPARLCCALCPPALFAVGALGISPGESLPPAAAASGGFVTELTAGNRHHPGARHTCCLCALSRLFGEERCELLDGGGGLKPVGKCLSFVYKHSGRNLSRSPGLILKHEDFCPWGKGRRSGEPKVTSGTGVSALQQRAWLGSLSPKSSL